MSVSNYTVPIPKTAIIVTTWDEYHIEGAKFPDEMVNRKYGGFVIEVDDEIKLATDTYMTQQIAAKLASLPPLTAEEEAELDRREQEWARTQAERRGA